MRSQEDADRLAELQAEADARADEAGVGRQLESEILADDERATWALWNYVQGDEVDVNPARVANVLALRETFVAPALGPELEDVTAQLIDTWPTLRQRTWASEVMWSWPGLVRQTRSRLGTSEGAAQLRDDMVEAVPALTTTAVRRIRRLFDPEGDYRWASLRSAAVMMSPPV